MTATQNRTTTVLAAMAALAVAAFLTVNLSMAAFSDTTATPENNWAAGTVEIDNDQTAAAAFAAEDIVPGYSESKTITVTNSSSVDTDVVLYAAVGGDGLAEHLQVEVTKDGATIYTGALEDMPADYANGTVTQDAPDAETTWVFDVSLPSSVGNEAQGLGATATFTWEARSR